MNDNDWWSTGRLNYILERDHPDLPPWEHVITIELKVSPLTGDTLKEAQKRAAQEMKKQWLAIIDRYIQAGLIVRDVEPRIAKHLRWLFLRLCPQPDIGRPWGWGKIAAAEGENSLHTVRNAVIPLAKEMGITLPTLPPGPLPRSY